MHVEIWLKLILCLHNTHIEHLHEEVLCQKNNFWLNDSFVNLAIFSCFLFCFCLDSAYTGKSVYTRAFTEAFCYFAYTVQIYWACAWRGVMQNKKYLLRKWLLIYNLAILYDMIVHMRGIQLVPQLVPKQFSTLPTQYRFIEHLHEEVWCQKNVFDKITAFWNEPFFPVCF